MVWLEALVSVYRKLWLEGIGSCQIAEARCRARVSLTFSYAIRVAHGVPHRIFLGEMFQISVLLVRKLFFVCFCCWKSVLPAVFYFFCFRLGLSFWKSFVASVSFFGCKPPECRRDLECGHLSAMWCFVHKVSTSSRSTSLESSYAKVLR